MGKREEQKQQRRREIIVAAKELFLTCGMQEVQMQDVADAAGVGIATLFRYFPKKEYLIIATSNAITNEMTIEIERIVAQPISAYDKLDGIMSYYMQMMDDPEHRLAKFFETFDLYLKMAEEAPEQYEEYLRERRKLADVLLSLAVQGKEDGSMRTDIDLELFVMTAIQNFSLFTFKSTIAVHDPALSLLLFATKQQQLVKDMFLQYIRPENAKRD